MAQAGTSLVLNIAEGNGRCLEADRRQFLETAESATVKAGSFLDLSHRVGAVDPQQRIEGIAPGRTQNVQTPGAG